MSLTSHFISKNWHFSCVAEVDHLMRLVECLLDSHTLAQKFNGNNAQRTLLWKAGFKGSLKVRDIKKITKKNIIHFYACYTRRSHTL